ncbi:MAG: class I SAM-dependent methyltransferase [Chloroflexi bacterium]|nr:class I SAM-dependent methyltransferase [Chloroflexota bacterium]
MVQAYIQRYVNRLNMQGVIFSSAMEKALCTVQIHKLIDDFYLANCGKYRRARLDRLAPDFEHLRAIYSGGPIIVSDDTGAPRRTLAAEFVTFMIESLELQSGMNVLHIGTNTGYEAALLSEIVESQLKVVTVGVNRNLVEGITNRLAEEGYGDIEVLHLDGFYGRTAKAPFDRILVTVGCTDISPHWITQLGIHGYLLVPMYFGGWYSLLKVWRESDKVLGRVVGSVGAAIEQIEGEGQLYSEDIRGLRFKQLDERVCEWPLWDGIVEDRLERLRDFWFYVGLRSGQCCLINLRQGRQVVASGIGLDMEGKGWAAITSGVYRLVGHEVAIEELSKLYTEWRDLEMPQMAEFRIEIVGGTRDRAIKAKPHWIVDRPLHNYIISLDET